MNRKIEIEAENYDLAMEKAIQIFKVSSEKIFLSDLRKTETGMVYEALLDVNLALEGRKFLQDILSKMNLIFQIEARTLANETEYCFVISSNENPLLIGKEGRTLDALQLLLKTYLGTFTNEHISVSLDIGNYHANRNRQLEVLATQTAKEVAKTKIPAKLRPMNSYERRIIHAKLNEWRDVYTESEGEGEDRAIVIYPKKKEN